MMRGGGEVAAARANDSGGEAARDPSTEDRVGSETSRSSFYPRAAVTESSSVDRRRTRPRSRCSVAFRENRDDVRFSKRSEKNTG